MDTWHDALGNEKQQPYFQEILNAVRQGRLSGQIRRNGKRLKKSGEFHRLDYKIVTIYSDFQLE